MIAVLVAMAAVGLLVWRFGSWLWPTLRWLGRAGDELGGWTIVYAHGGDHIKGAVTRTARWVMYGAVALAAAFIKPVRYVVAGWLVIKLIGWRSARSEQQAELAASGFSSEVERKVISDAVRRALLHIQAVTGKTAEGEIVPPYTYGWRKQPVLVGGKVVPGEWRYSCRIEPAPGKGIPQLMELVGRGLDADSDHIRDAVNSMLRASRGREPTAVRKAGQMPTFVLSTMQHVTKRGGGKIGRGKLTLWTLDPFTMKVDYPYDPAKPVVRHFSDPVPVGLLRSNLESTMRLDAMTGIQGMNGSGKSSEARPVLVAASHLPGVVIIVMALKGPADYIVLADRFAGGIVITDPGQACSVLEAAHVEIKRRNHLTKEQRSKLPKIFMLMDEGQELGLDIARIVPVVKLGRAAEVWLWSITQYGITSIIPSEAAREMGQREAGRIEGSLMQAQVAVGSRATKIAGPHLIPPDRDGRWVGVLFGADGYKRVYWLDEDGPTSMLGRCAAACPARPEDPAWFIDALSRPVDELPELELTEWPPDGAKRGQSGELRSFEVAALDDTMRQACDRVWALSGKNGVPVHGHITLAAARKVIEQAERRQAKREASDTEVADERDAAAIELLALYLSQPIETTGATT